MSKLLIGPNNKLSEGDDSVEVLTFRDTVAGSPLPSLMIYGTYNIFTGEVLNLAFEGQSLSLGFNGATLTSAFSVAGSLTAQGGFYLGGAAAITAPINIALAANTNNWSPTSWTARTLYRVTPTASHTITGIVAVAGGVRILVNVSPTYTITLVHESASSLAANRIACPNNANYSIPPNGSATLWYDGTSQRWRVLS